MMRQRHFLFGMICGLASLLAPLVTLATEALQLNAQGQQVPALYHNETTGVSHGGVLIVANINNPPSADGLVNSLRLALPNGHWHSLALDISDPTLTQPQVRAAIAAGIQYFNDKGVFNIALIGTGVGAAHAVHFVADMPPPVPGTFQSIRALILIDSNNAIPGSDIDSLQKLATITMPVLDAYSNGDLHQQALAEQRQQLRSRNPSNKGMYQQIRLPPFVNYRGSQENRTTNRIRGWLDKNVAGFMVNRKQ